MEKVQDFLAQITDGMDPVLLEYGIKITILTLELFAGFMLIWFVLSMIGRIFSGGKSERKSEPSENFTRLSEAPDGIKSALKEVSDAADAIDTKKEEKPKSIIELLDESDRAKKPEAEKSVPEENPKPIIDMLADAPDPDMSPKPADGGIVEEKKSSAEEPKEAASDEKKYGPPAVEKKPIDSESKDS